MHSIFHAFSKNTRTPAGLRWLQGQVNWNFRLAGVGFLFRFLATSGSSSYGTGVAEHIELHMRPISSNDRKSTFSAVFRRGLCLVTLTLVCIATSLSLSSCSSTPKKKPAAQASALPQKLPKPAPMRIAQDTNSRRKPPLLPKTIVNIPDSDDIPSALADTSSSPSETKVVDSTTPKFINNEQTQDFFQGAGDGPAGETVLGSFFDTVFRPANTANQPVSSTSYTVE
jgi:hypothetical protein